MTTRRQTNQTESSSARPVAEQIQILYVEDDHHFADLTTTVLEDEHDQFTIEAASTATEGLELLDGEIDCIVSDYNMPGMDGIEFLRAVRAEYPDLPFILFTGKGSEEVASDAISAGVTDYLQKEAGADQFTVLANRVQNAVEREQTREALQRKNTRLDTLVSNVPVILFALDSNGVFTLSKGQGLDRLGLELGEVVGQSIFDVYADAEGITTDVERALNGERVTAERVVDGVIFETTYHPVRDADGTVTSVIGVAIDITERTQQLQRAERERHKYKTLFETLPVAVARCEPVDGEPIVRDVNPAFENTFDIDTETVEDDPLHEHILPADQTDAVDELNRQILEQGHVRTEVEREVGDETRVFQLNVALQESAEDQICGYAVYTDLTEQKERYERLVEQNERLDRFAGVVSHDLRNPLQTASGHLDLAREECASEHLDSAADALARSQRLIDDLLTTARSGTRTTEMTAVDVSDVVRDCWGTIESPDATLRRDTPQTISADRTRVQQLFENLMRNAIEHGGDEVTVTAGALDDGFYVEDDGPGIPEDKRDDVFEAGYSTTEDGTGFGLSIVKQVADAHGWEIHVTDGSEGGARFEITGVEFTAA